MVENEGYAFNVSVVCEKLPEFYTNCSTIGHSVKLCNKLHPKQKIDQHKENGNSSKLLITINEHHSPKDPPVNNSKPTLEEDEQANAYFVDESPKDHPVKNSTQIPKENQPKVVYENEGNKSSQQDLILVENHVDAHDSSWKKSKLLVMIMILMSQFTKKLRFQKMIALLKRIQIHTLR